MKLIVFKLLTFSLILSVMPMTANAEPATNEIILKKEKETVTVPADELQWTCGRGSLSFSLGEATNFAYLKTEKKLNSSNESFSEVKCEAKSKQLNALFKKNKGKNITMNLTKDERGYYSVDKIGSEVVDLTVDLQDCKRSVGVDVVCPEGTYKYMGQQAANINSSAITKPAASANEAQATAVKNQAK